VRYAVDNIKLRQASFRVLYFLLSRSKVPLFHQRSLLIHLSRPLYDLSNWQHR